MDATPAASCVIISDGRRGIENQALGLAESLARLINLDITTKRLESSAGFRTDAWPTASICA